MVDTEKIKRREELVIEIAQHEEEMGKVRLETGLREGCMKPIDILTKLLNPSENVDTEINELDMVFKSLTVQEMEELHDDIEMQLGMERWIPIQIQYWKALLVVCDWEIAEAQKRDMLDQARVHGELSPADLHAEERELHATMEADVKKYLEAKTYDELEDLHSRIESEMCSGTAMEGEYWEAVIKRLHIYKAKAFLKEIHAKLKHLKYIDRNVSPEEEQFDHDEKDNQVPLPTEMIVDEELIEEADLYSPKSLSSDENGEAVEPEDNLDMMAAAMRAMGAMEEGDAIFGNNDEVNLNSQENWWHDEHRPKKPRYFNRVHTRYDRNKHRQTHCNHNNPPPKIVQGYKFNIFYQDLVDETKVPIYTIEKDGDSTETCIIRFHAGFPYVDIAFRIVKREWEYSHKKGFRCAFEHGIFHVYFNFKCYSYQR